MCNTSIDIDIDAFNRGLHAHILVMPNAATTRQSQYILDRIRKKWYDPDPKAAEVRAARLEYEGLSSLKESLERGFTEGRNAARELRRHAWEIPGREGEIVRNARYLLRRWLQGFKPSFNIKDVCVGPKANANYHGRIEELAKLDSSAWYCSSSGNYFMLRRVAKRNDLLSLCIEAAGYKYFCQRQMLYPGVYKIPTNRKHLWEQGLLIKTGRGPDGKPVDAKLLRVKGWKRFSDPTTLGYSKAVSIPKNDQKNRQIATVALGDQIAESSIYYGLLEVCQKMGNYIKPTGSQVDPQEYHKRAISNTRMSTIDFSAASDSNYLSVLEFMLASPDNQQLLKSIKALITPRVSISLTPPGGAEQTFNVDSPVVGLMGKRLTFVLMTLVLASFACAAAGQTEVRRFDPDSVQVFGDDVIIPNTSARDFVRVAELAGYRVNHDKTCIDKDERESCGAWHVTGVGYLYGYDIVPSKKVSQAVATCNKVLALYLHADDPTVANWLYQVWLYCFDALAPVGRGPIPDLEKVMDDGMGLYVFDPDAPTSRNVANSQLEYIEKCYCLPVGSLLRVKALPPEEVAPTEERAGLKHLRKLLGTARGTRTVEISNSRYSDLVVDVRGVVYGSFDSLRRLRSENIAREKVKEEIITKCDRYYQEVLKDLLWEFVLSQAHLRDDGCCQTLPLNQQ